MESIQTSRISKLLCYSLILTWCISSGNARPDYRRHEPSHLISSQTLGVTIRLSGGGDREEDRNESRKTMFGAKRAGNTINRYHDSLSHRLAYARIKDVVLSSEQIVKSSASYAPSVLSGTLAVLLRSDRSGLSLFSVYMLTLLGTSVGFRTFLYFITVGYGAGIGIPVALSLICNRNRMALVATLHALVVVIWSLRMVSFLLWRELVNWPALHKKLSQVNAQQSPDTMVKVLCWIFYSLAYFCVASPCWFSIQSTRETRGAVAWLGILLQVIGLVIETIADWQKSAFKASSPGNRYRWCREGLWNRCTHPNYAGEWIFWLGTLSVGLEAIGADEKRHIFTKLLQIGVMLTGFGFITATFRMNVLNMDHRLEEKYDTAFAEFKEQYSTFGPRWWRDLRAGISDLSARWKITKIDRLHDFVETVAHRKVLLQSSAKKMASFFSDKAKPYIDFNHTKPMSVNDGSAESDISQAGNSSETSLCDPSIHN